MEEESINAVYRKLVEELEESEDSFCHCGMILDDGICVQCFNNIEKEEEF